MHVYLVNLKMVWCQHSRLFTNHLKKHLSSIDPIHNFTAKNVLIRWFPFSHRVAVLFLIPVYHICIYSFSYFWGTSNQGSFLADGGIQGLQTISSFWHISWISLAYISNDWFVNIGKPVKCLWNWLGWIMMWLILFVLHSIVSDFWNGTRMKQSSARYTYSLQQ